MKLKIACLLVVLVSSTVNAVEAPQWEFVEIPFTIDHQSKNPYITVDGHVVFRHETGVEIKRPFYWDGGKQFAVRFASTKKVGSWRWELKLPKKQKVLSTRSGMLQAVPAQKKTRFSRHGFWHIPKGARQMVHRDGTSVVLVGDTAWALPWRATPAEAKRYAEDRQRKGFNAALLMTIQPDRGAKGSRDRSADEGFAVAFEDLPSGHINELNVDYFQYLDKLMAILIEHEIVPVFQPVFHGYGWKGLNTAGNGLAPKEYARFCKYLVARYGAAPAIWLVGGDGIGDAPGLDPAGKLIEQWDAYEHPTGIHYAPHGITDSLQDAMWLDFQWAQTGHNGEHLPEVAMSLYHQKPTKAAANGEPTYENMGAPGKASGWWQGHEAWSNLCAGGTMGVVYGAGSLWNWVHHPGEPGHANWTIAKGAAWTDALNFEGSTHVGNLGKILNSYATNGMEPNWRIAPARRGLYIPGKLFVLYLGNGGNPWVPDASKLPRHFRIYDPKTAEILSEGSLPEDLKSRHTIRTNSSDPRVVVFYTP